MRTLLAGVFVAASLASVAPACAQRIDLGPDGPRIDLRSKAQRERDFDRRMRHEEFRRERDADDRYYRRQRYEDDRPAYRRGYAY